MKKGNNDKQLIDKLEQLPKVEDHRDKDELFRRVSAQMNEKKPHKNYKLAPILSTLIVVLLIFVIIPVLINLGMSETSVNDSAENAVEESSHKMETTLEQSDADQKNVQVFDDQIESYVLQDNDENSTIIYSAVTDDELQTIIPVTIIIPAIENLTTHYNKMYQYLDETDWGVNQYLFNDVKFNLDLDNHEVEMQIPDHFSLGDGSANAHMFAEILTTMFTPYQIEKVSFGEEINLGSIGDISELPLYKHEKESYKVFQADENKRKFLIPIKIEDNVTIEEAFEDMKKGQASFNIKPTIPEDAQFSLTATDRELVITSDHDQIFEDEQKATIMIEAILMTAKSFGFELVTFNNISINQIGPYQLSESLEVPEAINPIFQ